MDRQRDRDRYDDRDTDRYARDDFEQDRGWYRVREDDTDRYRMSDYDRNADRYWSDRMADRDYDRRYNRTRYEGRDDERQPFARSADWNPTTQFGRPQFGWRRDFDRNDWNDWNDRPDYGPRFANERTGDYGYGRRFTGERRDYGDRGSRFRYGDAADRLPTEYGERFVGYDRAPTYTGGQRYQAGQYFGRGPRGYQRSDDRIFEDVCERLSHDSDLDASDIDVQVQSAEVTLTGTVESRWDKRRAEDDLDDVRGVRDVHNHLRVQTRGRDQFRSGQGRSTEDEWYAGAVEHRTSGGTNQGTAAMTTATGQAARAGTDADYRSTGTMSRPQLHDGLLVVGIDGDPAGTVKETFDDSFLLDRSMQRDVYVPFSAIQQVNHDRVVLFVRAGDIDNQGWENPPLTGAGDANDEANAET